MDSKIAWLETKHLHTVLSMRIWISKTIFTNGKQKPKNTCVYSGHNALVICNLNVTSNS